MTNNTYDSQTRFGYEILRDHVLPSILGKHEDDILYWAGKDVARKFPVFKVEELPDFFSEARWGDLSLEQRKKEEAFYTMKSYDGTNVQNRSCQLEAGFLAEQYQKLNGLLTECFGEVNSKDGSIHFHVKWDPKTKIEL
ncbi:YslB family protein [Sporosarcina limicola]|uniref:Hydrocarbon binding protein n=1 Tax=Sporosarcina limicola TaxID=34101 RepID=A0A927R2Z0_9BACL|nr:YslB family protein [Sporosarcina limicola]MBE1554476.1 putative hydrocarbon binding protein [Sporosarcina limicola]